MPLIELYPDRELWLDARERSVGGSEAYQAAFEPFPLWCKKSGLISGDKPDLAVRFRVGHHLEPLVHEFATAAGFHLWDPGDFTLFRSRTAPQTATPDRLWMPEPLESYPHHRVSLAGIKAMYRQAIGPAEFKTVSVYAVNGEPPFADWSAEEPSTYALMQCQHTMAVLEKESCLLAALIGFDKVCFYKIEANVVLQEALVAAERRFWDYVESGIQPPADESEASAAALKQLFPSDEGTEIEFDEEMAWPWFERLETARAVKKEVELEIRNAEIPIKEAMGANAVGLIGERGKFIWKQTKSGSRPLRLKRKESTE